MFGSAALQAATLMCLCRSAQASALVAAALALLARNVAEPLYLTLLNVGALPACATFTADRTVSAAPSFEVNDVARMRRYFPLCAAARWRSGHAMLIGPNGCTQAYSVASCCIGEYDVSLYAVRSGVTTFVDGPPPGQNSILTSFTKLPPSAALNPGSDPADSIAAASQGAVARIGARPPARHRDRSWRRMSGTLKEAL